MRALATAAAPLTAFALALPSPAVARPSATTAGCGGIERAGALHWHHGSLPPLAIGDSTMLLSLPALSREGFSVNARGCRQYPEALSLLSGLLRAHELPRLLVIALGANGQIEDGEVEQALRILGPDRLLVLVASRELGGGSGSDAQLVRAEGRRHPGRVVVLDWVSLSSAHPGWFQPDGLHLTLSGAAAFAQLIGRVLPLASLPKSLRAPPCISPSPAPGPGGPLRGVTAIVRGNALDVRPRSPGLRLTVTNANPFPVDGIASLRLMDGTRPTIATSCVSVPPQGSAPLTLRLDAQALADVELLGRYKVRLVLVLSGSQGESVTLGSTYLLRRVPTVRAAHRRRPWRSR